MSFPFSLSAASFAILLVLTSCDAPLHIDPEALEEDRRIFGHVQSFVSDLDGAPLIVANWHGRFRPYVYRNGTFEALLPAELEPEIRDIDLLRPLPVGSDAVLLAGHRDGIGRFDLFLFERRTLTLVNLTANPEVDQGDACVHRDSARLSFRDGSTQAFAVISGSTLTALESSPLPGLRRCLWLGADHVVGISGAPGMFLVHECRVQEEWVRCLPPRRIPGLLQFSDLVLMSEGRIGLVGLRSGDPFRAAYLLRPDVVLEDLPLGSLTGDVAEVLFDDEDLPTVRIGLHSTYRIQGQEDSSVVAHKLGFVGGELYGVISDAMTPRSLGVWTDGTWRFLLPEDQESLAMDTHTFQVWTRSRNGGLHQSIYFGPLSPGRVVIWLHGGPRENVSPRMNPYFHALNRAGYGVIALNFPGSTGRGWAYEESFGQEALNDAVESLLTYLKQENVDFVATWSISAGSAVQKALLRGGYRVMAMIDQAGGDSRDCARWLDRPEFHTSRFGAVTTSRLGMTDTTGSTAAATT